MKPRIPFRIGYQYGNWEQNLISIEDRIKESNLYLSYLWVGSHIKKFLNFEPDRTELIFHWDRLEVVILDFNEKSEGYYNQLNGALNERFPDAIKESKSIDTIVTKYSSLKTNYWCVFNPKKRQIKVMYFSKSFPPQDLVTKYNKIQLAQSFEELQKMLQKFEDDFKELKNLKEIRELTMSEKHTLKKTYQHGLALKAYLKRKGDVSNEFIRFYLYFLFKDRRTIK